MYPVFFRFGPLTVYSYGFMIATGICLTLFLIKRNIIRSCLDMEMLADMTLFTLFSGIVGARIFYVVLNAAEFKNDFVSVLKIWEGGLILYGGIIFAGLALFIMSRVKRLSFLSIADALIPFFALTQAFGRLGCFLNGCCWGKPWDSIFAVRFPFLSESVHPVQIYAVFFDILLFLFLLFRYRKKHFCGQITFLYFIMYPCGRFIFEFLRGDQQPIISIFTRPQIVSVIIVVVMIALLPMVNRKNTCD